MTQGKPAYPKRPGELAALWYREREDGTRYFSGKTEKGNRVCVYIDDNKKSERAPDARLFIYPLEDADHEAERRYGPRTPYADESLADDTEPEY